MKFGQISFLEFQPFSWMFGKQSWIFHCTGSPLTCRIFVLEFHQSEELIKTLSSFTGPDVIRNKHHFLSSMKWEKMWGRILWKMSRCLYPKRVEPTPQKHQHEHCWYGLCAIKSSEIMWSNRIFVFVFGYCGGQMSSLKEKHLTLTVKHTHISTVQNKSQRLKALIKCL